MTTGYRVGAGYRVGGGDGLSLDTTVPVVVSQVQAQVDEAREMIADVRLTSTRLVGAYADEREAYRIVREAQTNLDAALDEVVSAAEFRASAAKEGPLAGIAKTSDAYKTAVRVLRSEALAKEARAEQAAFVRADRVYAAASIEYESVKTQLSALKVVAELQTGVLRALAGH